MKGESYIRHSQEKQDYFNGRQIRLWDEGNCGSHHKRQKRTSGGESGT